MIGKTLGQYRILRKIGTGATATVWLGEHIAMGRRAAIKVLHPHLASDLRNIERLRREAAALSQLSHENVVRVYDFAADRDHCHIVSEFVDGPSLKEWLETRPDFPPELAVTVMIQVCRALIAAHALSIVHRDIKPENILIAKGGLVKLTDFGIARIVELDKMTVTGALLGSPNYMSPEQVECAETGPASDLFSAGVLHYLLLTRTLPFDGPTSARVFRNIADCRFTLPDAVNRRAGRLQSRLVEKCLRIKPSDRPASAKDLLSEFERLARVFGLNEPQAELAAFDSSPADYLKAFPPRLIASLLAFARERRQAKDAPSSLEAVSQVLLLEPANTEARALLRKRRHRGGLKAAITAAAILALTAFGVRFLTGHALKSAAPVPLAPLAIPSDTVKTPGTAEGEKTTPQASVRGRSLAKARVAVPGTAPMPPVTAPKPETTTVPGLQPTPPAPEAVMRYGKLRIFTKPWAKVYLDGEYRGKTPFQGEWMVPEGKHAIRLENPYCKTLDDTLTVAADSILERRYALAENGKQ